MCCDMSGVGKLVYVVHSGGVQCKGDEWTGRRGLVVGCWAGLHEERGHVVCVVLIWVSLIFFSEEGLSFGTVFVRVDR